MNTIGSVYYGWAFLICCGGGSYYFAKRAVNKDRYERKQMENERRYRQGRVMDAGATGSDSNNPAQGAAGDPAPAARSKFESATPYRSQKGDRFS